jgi:hypothetical protein
LTNPKNNYFVLHNKFPKKNKKRMKNRLQGGLNSGQSGQLFPTTGPFIISTIVLQQFLINKTQQHKLQQKIGGSPFLDGCVRF